VRGEEAETHAERRGGLATVDQKTGRVTATVLGSITSPPSCSTSANTRSSSPDDLETETKAEIEGKDG
jgi:hypothetical protein